MSMLNVGISALLTSQSGLSTTSHNISNVNTEGFSRQRVEQATNTPKYFGDQYVGNGVTIGSIERLYDSFLGSQVRTYTSTEAQQGNYLSYSKQLDELLGGKSSGISGGLNAFFNSASDVADDPTSLAARQVMLTEAGLLAGRFNLMDTRLQEIDGQINADLSSSVNKINNLSSGIAQLNQAIISASGEGSSANDLLDKRDQLINELSALVSVSVADQSNGAKNIYIGSGQALVAGTSYQSLSTSTDNATTPPRVRITYANTGQDITDNLSGGSIGGAIDFRRTIDSTRTELDLVAQSLVEGFNAVHNNTTNIANGGQGSVALDGTDGADFFTAANITAATISVAITDPNKIAASSKFDAATGSINISGSGNNQNMLLLANLSKDNTLVTLSGGATRTLSEHYSVLVSDVATKTRQAEVSQETQKALLVQTSQRFDSVSGVNLDEEAAQLIKYQQAYQAASQIIVVSNTVFDSLMSAV